MSQKTINMELHPKLIAVEHVYPGYYSSVNGSFVNQPSEHFKALNTILYEVDNDSLSVTVADKELWVRGNGVHVQMEVPLFPKHEPVYLEAYDDIKNTLLNIQ